jgi:hypothetical protein
MKTATPCLPGSWRASREWDCAPSRLHRDELARHRVTCADGYDVVVTTVHAPHGAWLTGAYPV